MNAARRPWPPRGASRTDAALRTLPRDFWPCHATSAAFAYAWAFLPVLSTLDATTLSTLDATETCPSTST